MSVCVQAVPIPTLILRVAEAANQTTPVMEKPVMRKARNTLRSVVTALVVLGTIAVVGHAQKVVPLASKPVPTASVTGGIQGQGDPKEIRIEFMDESFGPIGYPPGTVVISNPDYPPSLNIYTAWTGPGNTKTLMLSYYYCDSPEHVEGDLICTVAEHSLLNYRRLRILGGTAQKRSNKVVFPAGSAWEIGCKETNGICESGQLTQGVIYDVTK